MNKKKINSLPKDIQYFILDTAKESSIDQKKIKEIPMTKAIHFSYPEE